MNLYLQTITVWYSEETPDPHVFFNSLGKIISPSDIIVLGSYEWPKKTLDWLSKQCVNIAKGDHEIPYATSFDLNREQYPYCKEYMINYNQNNAQELSSVFGVFHDCATFLDHLLIYRIGNPLIPLVNYRYSFKDIGRLYLSGLYDKKIIKLFSEELNISISEIDNPMICP